MAVNLIVLLDVEAVEKSDEDEIELAIGQQGAGAHAISDAVGEEGGVRLFKPPLRSEDLWVGPDVGI